jgi:mRNA-degrading endonuclease RelE of RelBE toxin-antitoxin system
MKNEIYIAKSLIATMDKLPLGQQKEIATLIDSLGGDGWKNSKIVSADGSPEGGLRARLSGNLRVFFRYVPKQHSIIVVDAAPVDEEMFAAAS